MKTRNEKFRKLVAIATLVFSAVIMSANMNACSSKKNGGGGGGNVAVVPGGAYGCPTCTNGVGTLLASAMGFDSWIEVGLNFVSTQVIQTTQGYNGPVAASGYIYIRRQFTCNFTPGGQQVIIPAGAFFSASTLQPGTWLGSGIAAVESVRLQAGPITFVVGPINYAGMATVKSANPVRVASPPQAQGQQFPNVIEGYAYIESFNGQQCNPQGTMSYLQ